MRFYRIVIQDPTTGAVVTPPGFSAALLGGATYTSFVNGQSLPSAWSVEFDLPIIGAATPQGFGLVRVWGISVQEISQANNLGAKASGEPGKNIKVYGGFQKGLPLAKPQQSGLLFSGSIVQAFGNWIGTDMTLDLVVMPGPGSTTSQVGGVGTLEAPKNIVLNWKGGATLASALAPCLSTAWPGTPQSISISANLVRPAGDDMIGFYPTFEQLAQFVRQASLDIIKTAGYAGVSMYFDPNGRIVVSDLSVTSSSAPKKISFEDLIGQPTWIESPNISIKTAMRADLALFDRISLPPTLTLNTAQAQSTLVNQRAAFQGTFTVVNGRHVGESREPAADAWVSIFEATPNNLLTT